MRQFAVVKQNRWQRRSLPWLLAGILMLTGLAGVSFAAEEQDALYSLFAQERAFHYKEIPGTGPRGTPRPRAYRLDSVTPETRKRRQARLQDFKLTLQRIDRSRLAEADQLNYDMFAYMLDRDLLQYRLRTWRIPYYSDSGFHTYLPRMWQTIRFQTSEDYRAYIARLKDIPRFFKEHMDNMRVGIREGFVSPRIVLDGLLPTFSAHSVEKAEKSDFYTPFSVMEGDLTDAEKAEIKAAGVKAIMESVVPAYRALDHFIRTEYYPATRNTIGISQVPGGRAYYDAMVRYYTTLDITAAEVHTLGLEEVARIRTEMQAIIKKTGFKGSFKDFLKFLRTDPRFYATTPKQLLMHASYIAKKIDGRMPSLFGKMPRQPYGVEAVPASIAPNYTTGRYVGAALDAPRGGYYWVNTYALDKRPLYSLPALTLHEAVPGHHHQAALSRELENVPEFRLGLYPHAFGEGWGLYSEKLGVEMGIYETPYEDFGRLTYEMWRACRLVIDTGIHTMGWTRSRAIQLMEENSALSTHNIRTEVDRYISWPGQALAYKMGELKILELRKKAKQALGGRFDIRAFHDRLLSAGGVPLKILEQRIDIWIEQTQLKDTGASEGGQKKEQEKAGR